MTTTWEKEVDATHNCNSWQLIDYNLIVELQLAIKTTKCGIGMAILEVENIGESKHLEKVWQDVQLYCQVEKQSQNTMLIDY